MNFNLRENYSELLGAAVRILRKVENREAINLLNGDVKFLKQELNSNDVNDDIMHIINGNYYDDAQSEAGRFVWDIIRVIRKEPKPVEKCEPNRHIRIQPTFEC